MDDKYVYAGKVYKKTSENIKHNNGEFYSVRFRTVSWALFKTKEFDEVLKIYQEQKNDMEKRALYSIHKNGKGIGVVIPKMVKDGENKGKLYLLVCCRGQKASRVYYIFDVAEDGEINEGALVVFDITSEKY